MSIAKQLINIGALKLDTEQHFTWTSGIKSPIYCDNRLIISYPEVREEVIQAMIQEIQTKFDQVDVIAGCATAGIPHAAWVADRLNLPMVYVRDKAKGHGLNNQIEGQIKPNERVLVIEDLISTGGSSIKAADAVAESGCQVLGIVSIFSYNLKKSIDNMKDSGYQSYSLLTFDQLLDELKESGQFDDQQVLNLLEWRDEL
ncbi:orotate phosphoribosyltransferase [Aquisalibacillus elongatus]|uniref:Orotate phosphoribosyltransferase n=1 Tax=Aquisalibacillus elongatus TaxID=485577 RepID=A0A3N5C906_9BACI|nr:orotate phosphoribosyltransferase [Aquisalibacillus elongatus]RPF56052.1 orotate phosphoribosyltransferase [Aquisalibacillus elongatus]